MDPLVLLAGGALILSMREERRAPPPPRVDPPRDGSALEWARFVADTTGRIIDAVK